MQRPLAPSLPVAAEDPAPAATALGIDVGGTKIAGAVVTLATGRIAARQQIPTGAGRGGAAVLADVEAMARDLLAAARATGQAPVALGIGVAELVSPEGRVFSDHRIAWRGIDIAGQLSAILPATLSADVRAAALAEARHGAGRGIGDFLYVTIGTGVSGVLVQNGVPYAGSRGAALVIANGPTRHRCAACGHLASSEVEAIASGPGLAAAYGAPAEAVLAAAAAGEPRALAVIDQATHELGRVLALLAGSLDPAAIIIGGGLGTAPGVYFERLRRQVHAGLWDGDARVLAVVQSALGPDAGIIGAAAAAAQQHPRYQEPVHRAPQPNLKPEGDHSCH
jgi:glucokinase